MNILKSYGGLSRPVYILFFANIINRMGDFVKMFLTLYLTQVLHLAEKDAGTFVMLSAGASTVGGLIGGRLSDTIGRRRILILFFLLSGLIVGSCGFIPPSILTAWLLVPASMCIGGVRPVINSVVADLTGREERAKAYSLLYLGVNIGVAVGPMIAGFLFARYLRWIFWGDALTTFGALILIFLFVPETRPMGGGKTVDSAYEAGREEQNLPGGQDEESHLPEAERSEPGSMWRALLHRPVVLLFAPLAFFSHLIYAQHAFTLPLQLGKLFGESGASKYGFVMSANAVVVLVCTTFVLQIFGKRRSLSNMGSAAALFAVGFGMLAFVHSYPFFLLSVGIWTIGEVLMVTNASVFVANHTPINHRGRFNGFLSLVFGLGFTFAPLVSGQLVGPLGVETFWMYIGLLAALTSLLFFFLSLFDRRRHAR